MFSLNIDTTALEPLAGENLSPSTLEAVVI
jgi:hypothetical protein